jgi:predicted transcriptional regulator
MQLSKIEKKDWWLYLIILITFIVTEIFDDFLDHLLGLSRLHSIIQLFVFLLLFFIVSTMFQRYYNKKINRLIPEDLMNILAVIKEYEVKGVLINQSKIRSKLNITKPTLKKRLDSLIELNYIFFEKDGNDKYLKLTSLGNSIIK